MPPAWLTSLLGVPSLIEGAVVDVRGQSFIVRGGIPRSQRLVSDAQAQTREAFGFKWRKRDTYESPARMAQVRAWLRDRYGDLAAAPWLTDGALFIDAGCGSGVSGMEMLGPALSRVHYLGIDVSDAVDVARDRFTERGVEAAFLQADIANLPLRSESADVIVSEGVLHHTNSTEGALGALARLLKVGGHLLFYVYRRKGPVREFTDDYIRAQLQMMSPEAAWRVMGSLTHLGIALGELDAFVDVAEPIELLGIPAGRISVQRLFYWHVAKAFYHPDLTFDETNHINFDWYAPANAHRQSPEEVRDWCAASGLVIERETVEDAGITVIARKD